MRFNEAMYEVLETRRYDRLMGRTRNIREIVSDFIERQIIAFFDWLNLTFPEGIGNARAIPVIFAIVGGILLAVGVFVLIRMIYFSRRAKVFTLADLFEELADNRYTVGDLLAKSNQTNDRRLAVRYRYIAALLALDEKSVIQISPSATNALILRALKQNHPLMVQPFAEVADTFHLAWFGNKEITDHRFGLFCAAGERLIGAGHV
jgi:hypothetical protein